MDVRFRPLGIPLIPLSLILCFWGFALQAIVTQSPTVDESAHITRAQSLWQIRDLRLQTQPPFSHWLIGSLLWLEPDVPLVSSVDSWPSGNISDVSQQFMWEQGINVERFVFLARLPIAFLGLIFIALIQQWSRSWWGFKSSWLATLLAAFSPNFLAFASLATTDFVTAVTNALAIFGLWRYWRRPGRSRLIVAGLFLGIAMATKPTLAVLVPVSLILCYSHGFAGRRWWQPAVIWFTLLPIAGFVLWTLYQFEFRLIDPFPLPIPAGTFLNNFLNAGEHISRGHATYLLGSQSLDGWWYYFLVVLAVKTPVATLTLLFIALVFLWRQKVWHETSFLWLPILVLFVAASYSRLNIGLRHILAIFPLIWLLIAASLSWWLRQPRRRILLFGLLAWYAIFTAIQTPHFLPFFNVLVGGSEQGHRYLGDSNLDWGQDLHLLAERMASVDDTDIYISYFGPNDLTYYKLPAEPDLTKPAPDYGFAPANPAPGVYGLSVSHVQGMVLTEPDLFSWFSRLEPFETLGHSINIYEVNEVDQGGWLALCFTPVPMFAEGELAHMVGQPEIRELTFDCSSSWVFPENGSPGWFALPLSADPWPIFERFPDQFELVYQRTRRQPGYQVYYWHGVENMSRQLTESSEGSIRGPDDLALSEASPATAFARLLGFWEQPLRWVTIWQTSGATDQPLSIVGHLYGSAADPVVADGLGYPANQWQPDDIFLQFHQFPAGSQGEYFATGFYNYLTGERFPFEGIGQNVDTVRLYADR